MKLTDLHPRWAAEKDAPPDARQGVTFECPHCRQVRLGVFFANPICSNPAVDPQKLVLDQALHGHLADHHLGEILWQRTGETFETLTLSPSIDASKSGHWHGFIRGGEVT